MNNRISASIVTYRTDPDELKRTLDTLSLCPVGCVIVVDNSPDDSLRCLSESYECVRYIHRPDNPGYGRAHNIAIKNSIIDGTEYHLVLNSDVRFDADAIDILVDYMDRNRDVGQVIPDIFNTDGTRQYSVRMLPTPADLFLRRFAPSFLTRKLNDRYLLRNWDHSVEMNIPYHQGSFILFRVSALAEIEGFDERFFMYPEDIDITRRMHEKYKTMFCPSAKVIHEHRAASYHSLRMLRIHCINMVRYFNKWGWFRDDLRTQFNRQLKERLDKINTGCD